MSSGIIQKKKKKDCESIQSINFFSLVYVFLLIFFCLSVQVETNADAKGASQINGAPNDVGLTNTVSHLSQKRCEWCSANSPAASIDRFTADVCHRF